MCGQGRGYCYVVVHEWFSPSALICGFGGIWVVAMMSHSGLSQKSPSSILYDILIPGFGSDPSFSVSPQIFFHLFHSLPDDNST